MAKCKAITKKGKQCGWEETLNGYCIPHQNRKGGKENGNPYKIKGHIWIPFSTYAQEHLRYKSWGKYPKDFDTISNWFKELMPLYAMKKGDKEGFVEGVVFTHPDGRMAKLRRDQFDWHVGRRHKM